MIRGIAALMAIAAIGGWVSFFKLRANMQTWVAAAYKAIDLAEECQASHRKFQDEVETRIDAILAKMGQP